MADLSRMIATPSRGAGRSPILRGRVRRAPTSPDDTLLVSPDSISIESYEVPAGNWVPRGAELPALGTLCLILFDEFGEAYVASYVGPNGFGEGAFAFFNG